MSHVDAYDRSVTDALESNKALVRRLYHEGFLWRAADGRLAESWGLADRFQFLQERGVVPSDDELAARAPKED